MKSIVTKYFSDIFTSSKP